MKLFFKCFHGIDLFQGEIPAGSPSLKEYLKAGKEALSSPAVKKTRAKGNTFYNYHFLGIYKTKF